MCGLCLSDQLHSHSSPVFEFNFVPANVMYSFSISIFWKIRIKKVYHLL